eukprot:m.28558 g.28558  ORF g.28558 m.28558 type:complete len:652 (-) comp6061_c0_seq1:433-2388(-)
MLSSFVWGVRQASRASLSLNVRQFGRNAVLPTQPLASLPFFVAKRLEDEPPAVEGFKTMLTITQTLLEERGSVLGNATKFADLAFDLLHRLTDLPTQNPFHIPRDLSLCDPPMSSHQPTRLIFEKAFITAFNAKHDRSENFSGYAFAGPKGVGKSTALRHAAMVSGLLLPNLLPVYLEAASENSFPTPHSLLLEGLRQCFDLSEQEVQEYSAIRFGELVARVHAKGWGTALFVDELREMYNREAWTQLHAFVSTTCATAAFVADSSSILSNIVCRTNTNQIKAALNTEEVLHSLNDTKLHVIPFSGFTTRKEYEEYLTKGMPELLVQEPKQTRSLNDLIHTMHIYTGGRMRDLRRFDRSTPRVNPALIKYYPLPSTPCHHIFKALARKGVREGTVVDVFDMPSFNQQELEFQLKKYPGTLQTSVPQLLYEWVEQGLLSRNEQGQYTFATPYHYLQARSSPRAFISLSSDKDPLSVHASQKSTNEPEGGVYSRILLPLCTQLSSRLCNHVELVTMYDDFSQVAMNHDGLSKWMTFHAGNLAEHSAVILLLTPEYVTKVQNSPKSGCAAEFGMIKKQLLEGGSQPLQLLIVYEGDKNCTEMLKGLCGDDINLLQIMQDHIWYAHNNETDVVHLANRLLCFPPDSKLFESEHTQ